LELEVIVSEIAL